MLPISSCRTIPKKVVNCFLNRRPSSTLASTPCRHTSFPYKPRVTGNKPAWESRAWERYSPIASKEISLQATTQPFSRHYFGGPLTQLCSFHSISLLNNNSNSRSSNNNHSKAMPESPALYAKIDNYDEGFLKVSDIHTLYYEQSGNPEGKPVIYLHGGPGGGVSPHDRRYFDPAVYRIILLDQRGAGKSTPTASLEDNTTWALVDDIEKLREHLKIDKWVVFGGSWGSTLSLVYAQEHPSRVKALILRGIFMLRKSELTWFYEQGGASNIFPDAWDEYLKPIPEEERHNMIEAYHKRLTGSDEEERIRCAKAWSTWECSTSKLYVDPVEVAKASEDIWALAFARIECHYFFNKGFFKTDAHILENIDKIRHIPATIVQGRYDVVCPATSAWDLHKAWPEAQFEFMADAGHSAKELATTARLVKAADEYKTL